MDDAIQLWDLIPVSAGVRGTQVILRPEDYLRPDRSGAGRHRAWQKIVAVSHGMSTIRSMVHTLRNLFPTTRLFTDINYSNSRLIVL